MRDFILFTLYYYTFYNLPFLPLLILSDNLVLAFNTFCFIYYPTFTINFYNQSYIDRYIYYFILFLTNLFLTILCFGYYPIFTFILYLTTLPYFFKTFINIPIVTLIKKRIKKIFNFTLYYLLSSSINQFCTMTINYNPCLNNKDVKLIYQSDYIYNLQLLIKNFIALTIIKSLSSST